MRAVTLALVVAMVSAMVLVWKRDAKERIISGTSEDPGKYPWLVSFPWRCGGALIGPRTVLTAAHCIPDASVGSLKGLPVAIKRQKTSC